MNLFLAHSTADTGIQEADKKQPRMSSNVRSVVLPHVPLKLRSNALPIAHQNVPLNAAQTAKLASVLLQKQTLQSTVQHSMPGPSHRIEPSAHSSQQSALQRTEQSAQSSQQSNTQHHEAQSRTPPSDLPPIEEENDANQEIEQQTQDDEQRHIVSPMHSYPMTDDMLAAADAAERALLSKSAAGEQTVSIDEVRSLFGLDKISPIHPVTTAPSVQTTGIYAINNYLCLSNLFAFFS